MEIYYIDIDEFKKHKGRGFLEPYNDIKIKNEKRFFEYTIGRYLVKTIAKDIYNLNNTDIVINDKGKPVFKEGQLCFNISHSKNMVVACFDKNPVGIDIEFIKNKDLAKFSNYFKRDFKDLEDFYKFWTYKEAIYKLGDNAKSTDFFKYKNKYYITVASSKNTKIPYPINIFKNSPC